MNIQELTLGMKFIFKGFRAIKDNKSLWMWLLAPILIDLFLLVFLLGLAFSKLSLLVTMSLGFIFSEPTGFIYSLLYYPLFLILALGFSVIIVYGIYLIGTVIASPFNSVIAEKVLMRRGIIEEKPFVFSNWLRASLKMMLISLVRTFIFIIIGIILLVCSFIPGLNLFSSFMAFVILAFDNMDYTYEVMQMNLSDRFVHFKNHAFTFSGMATVIGVTLFVPGLTLLLMPVLVAGAASIYQPQMKRVKI